MTNFIVAVVGMCGTGKSVVTDLLRSECDFCRVYFGGFVLEEVRARGLQVTHENERTVREDLRRRLGMDALAQLGAGVISDALQDHRNVVIDGLYSFAEYEYLRAKFSKGLILLALHASRTIRYERMARRIIRPLSAKEVDDRDYYEIKNLEKGGPIAIADFHVVNDRSLDELFGAVRTVVSMRARLYPRS